MSKGFKHFLIVAVGLVLLATTPLVAASVANQSMSIAVDGRTLMHSTPLVRVGEIVMIPFIPVAEALGYTMRLESSDRGQGVIAERTGVTIRVRVDDTAATVNQAAVVLDAAPRSSGGRIMVPLTLVGSHMGATVEFNSATRRAAIFTNLGPRNVIFLHPDGTSPEFFGAARKIHYGPDGETHWDRLPAMAVYKGHLLDSMVGTSNSGAVTHAYGIKAWEGSFGLDQQNVQLVARSGRPLTLMEEAKADGFSVGMINTATVTEPGSGAWGARVANRADHLGIAHQLIIRPAAAAIDVILGGGEVWFLPNTVVGRHGERGRRTDGVNLITEAQARGYRVIYTLPELLSLPADTTKVLGLFAALDTFQTTTEEVLRAANRPDYDPAAPTFAQMVDVAIRLLSRNQTKGFYLVAEEEGTDNLPNSLNARGTIEATKRADDAIGVAVAFARTRPNTLVITAADSEASGFSIIGNPPVDAAGNVRATRERRDAAGQVIFVEYLDGRGGTSTPPFLAAPDRNGVRWPFAVSWSSGGDTFGSIVARAFGLHSEMVTGTIDSTEIYRIKYRVLFNRLLP